jgi:hypothetical protein
MMSRGCGLFVARVNSALPSMKFVLLRLARANSDHVRAEARSLAAAHIAQIRAKIADLQAMERVLSEAICECDSGQQPRCPLIEVLSADSGRTVTSNI